MIHSDSLRDAITERDAARVAELLAASPDLATSAFDDGWTPLHVAAEANHPAIVELLVRAGASLTLKFGRSAHTPLSWALTCESLDAARKLVDLGAEADLFCSAGLGDLARVRAFWRDGTLRPSPSNTGSSRYTESDEPLPRPPENDADQVSDALYLASRLGQLDVACWLLDHGADPNWRGYCGASCLAWAEFSGNAELCALLRERGASETIADHSLKSPPRIFPVMVFANWGFGRRLYARVLADRSLANAMTGIGTPLHAAALGGQMECAQILLVLGADRSAHDPTGRTPAEIASAKGYTDLAALLSVQSA